MADGARNLTANFTASTTGFSRAITELKAQLSSLNTALAQNRQQIKDVNTSITANRREYNQLQQEVQRNGTATEEQRRRLEQLANEYAQLTADLGSLQTAQADLRNQIRQTNNQLNEQANAAEQQSKALDKVKSAAQDAGKYFAGLGATAAAAFSSVLALTAKYAAAADDINTLAKTTGLATDEIQRYQYASDLCDVSLETVTGSLTKLKNNMQSARDGNAALQASFSSLGVTYTNTDGTLRDSYAVFTDIITALSKIENQTERDAAAMDILGRSASALNPIITDGGEAFRKTAAEMDKYILPQETLDRLNAFNDHLDMLKARGTGVLSQVAAELSDGFDPLFDTANSLLDKVQSAIDSGEIEQLAREVAAVINDVADALGNAIKFCIDFREEIAAGAAALVTYQAALKIGNLVEAAINGIKSLTAATQAQTAAQTASNAAMTATPWGAIAAAIGLATGAVMGLQSALDDCNERTQKMLQSVGDLTKKSEEYRDKSDKLGEIAERYEEITSAQDGTEAGLDELRKLQDELVANFGSEANGIDLVTAAFSDQDDILEQLLQKRREYNQISADYAQEALDQLNRAEENNTAITTGNLFSGQKDVLHWAHENLQTFDLGATAGAEGAQFGLSTLLPGVRAVQETFFGDTFYLKGTYEERAKDLEELYRYLTIEKGLLSTDETVQQVKTLQEQMEKNAADRDKYQKVLAGSGNGEGGGVGRQRGGEIAPTNTTTETVDATLLNRLKSAYGQGMMSTADYYNNALDIISNIYGTDSSEYESTKSARDAWAAPLEEDLKLLKRKKDRGEIDDNAYYSEFLRLSKELYGSGDSYEDAYTLKLQHDKKAAEEAAKAEEKRTAEAQKAHDDAYKAEKQALQNKHDFELLSDEEYYNQAYALAVQYYGATNQTAIDAEKELYKFRKKQAEEFRKEQLDSTKAAYSELFAAIDAETQKRERAKEDAALAERERILSNRLAYEQMDEFSRAELEEELAKLQEEKNDLLYDRSVEDAKAAAEEVYELAQQAYEDASVDLNAAMSQATAIFSALGRGTKDIATAINNTTNTTTNNNQAVTVQVDAFNKTLDQLVDAFRKAISSDL